MTTFIDTSVLPDVLDKSAEHHSWCTDQLNTAKAVGPVIVSDAVYSEFSVSMSDEQEADKVLTELSLVRCGYSNQALFRAGRAYARYRKNKGIKLNVLPDFFIGALADVEGVLLVTRDPGKVKTYFPNVQLIAPEKV